MEVDQKVYKKCFSLKKNQIPEAHYFMVSVCFLSHAVISILLCLRGSNADCCGGFSVYF